LCKDYQFRAVKGKKASISLGCWTDGQFEPDHDPFAGYIGAYSAAVGLNQFLDDGQADSGAAVLSRAGFFTAVKALKKEGQVFRSQIPALVGVSNPDGFKAGFDVDVESAVLRRIPGGIVGHVAQHPRDPTPIGRNR
jgi:hypothetical protein